MASQPHDKSGKLCADCKAEFTRQMAAYTLHHKEGNLIVHRTVCVSCFNKHHSKGE